MGAWKVRAFCFHYFRSNFRVGGSNFRVESFLLQVRRIFFKDFSSNLKVKGFCSYIFCFLPKVGSLFFRQEKFCFKAKSFYFKVERSNSQAGRFWRGK